jgi:hypothetical protein
MRSTLKLRSKCRTGRPMTSPGSSPPDQLLDNLIAKLIESTARSYDWGEQTERWKR